MTRVYAIVFVLLLAFIASVSILLLRLPRTAPLPRQQSIPTPGSRIQVVSDSKHLSVSSFDAGQIDTLLSSQLFFQPLHVAVFENYGKPTQKVQEETVSRVVFVLTDQEQPMGRFLSADGQGHSIVGEAFGERYEKATQSLTIFLFVAPYLVQQEPADRLAQRFQTELLTASWVLTHDNSPETYLASHNSVALMQAWFRQHGTKAQLSLMKQ